MNRVDGARMSIKCASWRREVAPRKEVTPVPFRKHDESFTPEQLDILTAALSAANAELITTGVEISQPDLAKRILDRAADGIFDVAELKRAALEGLI
jgi:hypothetical protein